MTLLALLVVVGLVGVALRAAWRRTEADTTGDRHDRRPPDGTDAAALWHRREELRRRRREGSALPPLPDDDTPPPGLPPMVASPRTVRIEAARGIRELEDWLSDQTSA